MTISKTTPTTGRVRERNKAKIFQAAKQEFAEHGFAGASIKRIAELAELPRANIHYYFEDKADLYRQLLTSILAIWNTQIAHFTAEEEPKQALEQYIRDKVIFSMQDPSASRIFASEMIHGAPHLQDYLADDFRQWIAEKVGILQAWQQQGKLKPVDPYHLLFMIWSTTQHYADFNVQVLSAMNKTVLDDADIEHIITSVTRILFDGCF